MKRIILILAAAIIGMACASAQESLKLNSVKISSIRPTSFTSLSTVVTVNVTSTREKTVISDISGTVYSKDGKPFVTGTAQSITILPGTSDVVIYGAGALASNVGIMSFLRNISYDPDNYTADISCTVCTGDGEAHKVEMKGVSRKQ